MSNEAEKEAEPPTKKIRLESDDPSTTIEEVLGLPHSTPTPANEDADDDDSLFGDGDEENDEEKKDVAVETPTLPSKTTPPSSTTASTSAAIEEDIAIPRKTPSTPPKDDIVIPRKSPAKSTTVSSLPQSSSALVASNETRVPGARYGLPHGVVVPKTIVDNRLLDVEMHAPGSKLLAVLKSLPVNLINDALTEYDDAVEIKGAAAIRNHGAYLYGVVKRYVSVHERALAGEGGILPMGEDGLTEIVEQRLQQLVTTGFCSVQEMNDKVKSKIRMLSEKDALFALDELSSVERSSIRNFGSYFMGILNRYMRGDASTKAKPKQHQQHHQNNRPPQSSSYNPRDRDQYNNNAYRSGGNDSFRNHDNRQQKPWQQPPHHNMGGMHRPSGSPQQSHMPHQGGSNGMMPYNNNQQPGGYGARPSHPPSPQFRPNQQQQPPPFRQQQQQPPFVPPPAGFPPGPPPQQQQQGYPNRGNNNNGYQAGLPPPLGGNMGGPPPQFQHGGHQQQQQQQQFNNMQQPQNNNGMQHLGGPPQQRMPPQQQQQFRGGPQGWQNPHQHQQQPGGVDIRGLAEQAASAIQALGGGGGQNNMNNNFQPPHQQGGYPPYHGGGDRGMAGQHQPNMPPQSYAPPGQGAFPPQQNIHMSGLPPGAMHNQQQQQPRRRTTATIAELPIAVQYAVQNLTATGALDGLPDEGIMGMIFDLPEPLALVTLQKFETLVSAKHTMMRNKTAYLAGVLRRELEKINRR